MEGGLKADRALSNLAAAKWMVLVVATLSALVLAEIGARAASSFLHRPSVFVRDPYTGWRARANLEKVLVEANGGRFRLSTDGDGHRLSYPRNHPIGDSAPVVLLLGDSFVQGLTVEDEETFVWLLAREFENYRFVNMGVAGYGTDQELVQLERYMESHPSTVVGDVVVVVFENDFEDVQRSEDPYLGRTKPVYHLDQNGLFRGRYQLSWTDHLMDTSRLGWLIQSKWALISSPRGPPAASGIPLVRACLEAMRTVAETRSARLHIFGARHALEPKMDQVSWNKFIRLSEAVDTDRIRGANVVSYDGGHWNAEGHRQLAALIKNHVGFRPALLPAREQRRPTASIVTKRTATSPTRIPGRRFRKPLPNPSRQFVEVSKVTR